MNQRVTELEKWDAIEKLAFIRLLIGAWWSTIHAFSGRSAAW